MHSSVQNEMNSLPSTKGVSLQILMVESDGLTILTLSNLPIKGFKLLSTTITLDRIICPGLYKGLSVCMRMESPNFSTLISWLILLNFHKSPPITPSPCNTTRTFRGALWGTVTGIDISEPGVALLETSFNGMASSSISFPFTREPSYIRTLTSTSLGKPCVEKMTFSVTPLRNIRGK